VSPGETLRAALRALRGNPMRSFLTALGIIIGVAAVIAMVAIGEGAKAQVSAAFASMGTNLLVISPGTTGTRGVFGGFGSQPTLTWEDLRAIRKEIPEVSLVSPQLRTTAQVIVEEQNWTTSVNGVWPEYFEIRRWPMTSGAAFTSSDVDTGTKVVVLGQTVLERLYGPNADPVGQVVRIRNVPFQVAAVMARKGQSPMGQNYDDAVFVPASTFQSKIQGGLSNYVNGSIFVGCFTSEATARAERRIGALLRDRHHLSEEMEDDFRVRNLTEIASAQEEGTRTLTALLASIAAVSLVVGGIGIMNIMLVSVTERTREIGIRKAVGARRAHILSQFLAEAVLVSVLGGLTGVAAGVIASRFEIAGVQPVIATYSIFLAFGAATAAGLFFGTYPAGRAAAMRPMEALRFE